MRIKYILLLLGIVGVCVGLLSLPFLFLVPVTRTTTTVPRTVVLDSSQTTNAAERVAFFKQRLHITPPAPIQDVNYIEVQIGDGFLGPVDYQFYARVTLAPADIEVWQQMLQAHTGAVPTSLPIAPAQATWWPTTPSAADFNFYEATPLLGQQGFIALDPQGYLYIYTFTT